MHFTLADLITDITQNGAEAGAGMVELSVRETVDTSGKGEFRFTVKDNGRGMTAGELKLAQDPFITDGVKHPNRKVGLGLPFLIQTAGQSGGGWEITSEKKREAQASSVPHGTTVSAWFDLGNLDTPPTGDIPGMFRTVLLFEGPGEMVIRRTREAPEGGVDYEVRKTELVDALGGLQDAQSLILLDKYLRSLEE
ncbi:MAG: ATP-binding protein [Treponema sp.]|nr:ATP-binding protein [Treponema sp.]